MARTTSSAVEGILGPNYVAGTVLTPFIDTASAVVDRAVTLASAAGLSYSALVLELMERWLSGHYYTQMDPMFKSKKTGDAAATYRDVDYLQVAKELDPLGLLITALSSRRASAMWVGKRPADAIAYEDR